MILSVLIDSTTTGKIIDINKSKAKATVLAGSIKMQVKLNDLFETREKKKEKTEIYSNFQISNVNYRLDIRGEKPEVAEFQIIKFLDEAYQGSLRPS